MHLHLTSTSPEHQLRTVETALSLGGRHLNVGQLPDEDHVVLGDPGGTKVSWGGPPVAPKHGRNRQRLDLAAVDLPRRWRD